jgi:succinoglycan biosynthesis transport protein ExoP
LEKSVAGGVATFGMVVFGILFLDLRSRRVNSSMDVSQSLGLSVIGAVPMIPSRAIRKAHGGSRRYHRYRTLMAEAMRGVMVRLLHDTPPGQSRVIFVSSASSGEGKSTLATNLGVAMARAGYRTLLVDSDLRRPDIDKLFDLPDGPGLGDILRRRATVDESINEIDTKNLDVMPAGRWSPHDVSLLANGATEQLFADLRERYQYVIVDSAPILGVAESQLLCRHADTVLMSIFRDVSSEPEIMAACETLANFGVRSVCAVVTGSSAVDYKHYYSGYGLEDTDG